MSEKEVVQTPSKKPLYAGLAVLVAVAVFIGWGSWKATHPDPVPLQGMVDARTVSVSAKIPGRLDKLNVREGDQINAGDVVAELSIPEIEAKLSQVKALKDAAKAKEEMAMTGARKQEKDAAMADLERAKAGLLYARKTYERIHSLYQEGLISAQKHDEVTAQLTAAKKLVAAASAKVSVLNEGARVEDKAAAKALLAQAEGGVSEVSTLVAESMVKSPISGEVTRIVMEEGEISPAGFPIILVTDLKDSWIVFNIREDNLPGIEMGSRFTGYVPAIDQEIPLEVTWINPRGEYAVWRSTRQSTGYDLRTFEVRLRPVSPVDNLRPGMTVIIER